MSLVEEMGKIQGEKEHFVLVHGISLGSWCWYKMKSLMENSGFKVTCIDLKGAGIDPSDANSIHLFDDYNQPLLDFLSSLPPDEQVILVGHSAGGLSVSQAILKFPKKIKLAVYLAAAMLEFGFLTDQDVVDGAPDLGDVYDVGFGMGADGPPTSVIIKKEYQRKISYQLSPHEDCSLASLLMRPGPLMALLGAKFTDQEDLEEEEATTKRVRRVYIKTKQDNVLKIDQQEAMIKKWPPCEVLELDADHSPFFSSPFLLFGFFLHVSTLTANQ